MTLKRKIVLLAVVGGVGLWVTLRWLDSYAYANFPPQATGPWIAFGDSLTQGFGATEGNDYPARLGQMLEVPIQNLSRSGDSTVDALLRLEAAAQLKPRVVLLCLGGNDGLQHLSPASMFANLERIIARFQQEGSFVVLIGIRSASLRDQNKREFRRLARRMRVLHVPDALKGIFPKPVYMTDALHPNDAGYLIIAKRLEKALRPLLAELRRDGEPEPVKSP